MTHGQDDIIVHIAAVKRMGMTHRHCRQRTIRLWQMQQALKLNALSGELDVLLSYFWPFHHSLILALISFS